MTSCPLTIYHYTGTPGPAGGSGGGGGATTFEGLTNTPDALGTAGQYPIVNTATDALEWAGPIQTGVAPVGLTSTVIWHSPEYLTGVAGTSLLDIVRAVASGSGTTYNLFATRQTGSFVSAANYRTPTTETLTVGTESRTALVLHWPGNIFTRAIRCSTYSSTRARS